MRTLWIFLLILPRFCLLLTEDGKEAKAAKPKKHNRPKIKEEANVLVLKSSNFARALQENKYLLVKFYIALSGPSQTISEEFSKAAGQLIERSSEIRFGKVDITAEKDLGKEFNIQEFPTLKLFVNGDRKNPIDCKGVRSAPAFITWMNRRIGPSAVLINSTDQAQSFIHSENMAVVGFFKDLLGETAALFYEAAKDVPEIPFGVVGSEDIFANYGVIKNIIAVFKKGKPAYYEISEEDIHSTLDLIRLIRTYNMDLVTEYNLETSVTIFDVPIDNHILLFAAKSSETFSTIYENYESAAVEFRGKIVFVFVDTEETRNGRIFEYFRITEVDVPAIRILNLTSDVKYRMPADDVTFENLRSFCQDYLDGKAKPKLDSEEIPEDWDKGPVKVLVGKNFNKVAFSKSKSTFVMFYAPWSRECNELFPVWEELGRKYDQHENITIAKIDCAANDIQLMVLDRYPYFRLFPAGSETQTIRYTGERTLEAFSEFLEKESKARDEEEKKSRSSTEDLGNEQQEKPQKEEL
ncbi:protein disulfide-isomerase-like protein of the testis [Microcaecilia unicolor]|uniref:protein disulfide-isomerase n=1 Tax=Microcaecilia unicolor TaxID=1415580 RepID=A0A6P7YKD3_9AMPH|nr:protein disulfide-isomerase-like protein of the testis [Microcaecilia unicolor]